MRTPCGISIDDDGSTRNDDNNDNNHDDNGDDDLIIWHMYLLLILPLPLRNKHFSVTFNYKSTAIGGLLHFKFIWTF